MMEAPIACKWTMCLYVSPCVTFEPLGTLHACVCFLGHILRWGPPIVVGPEER